MNKIDARSKSVRELLEKQKYSLDYYQREYVWEQKQIQELLEDLFGKFAAAYESSHEPRQVKYYPRYFLGSIVISEKEGERFIIDGQQRLTSLTLLLVFLNRLQQGHDGRAVDVRNLVFSETYGEKSFNLDVDERADCLDALYNGREPVDPNGSRSVRTILARYQDIEAVLPDLMAGEARAEGVEPEIILPYFIDWLLENVDLVQITAYSDDDAYTIFETMNDRGLSLTPAEMLKGYLLANIADPEGKAEAHRVLKLRSQQLEEIGKEEEADFLKAWLRAKYAETIRERKKGASNEDFEKIGTAFHRWVRDEHLRLGLRSSADFATFIKDRFSRFGDYYVIARGAALTLTPGLEPVFYNAYNAFTLQYPLMLAPLRESDNMETARKKMRLVAGFADFYILRKAVNYKSVSYSATFYAMFNLMKKIRCMDVAELAIFLKGQIDEMEETFSSFADFGLNQWSRRYVQYILARLTSHIEEQSGMDTAFQKYVDREAKKPYEIEHIWAENYDLHRDEFDQLHDFDRYRNRIGDLLLLPRGFNQSLGDSPYEEKLPHYNAQNLLARSLSSQCYQNNPSFLQYGKASGLPFHPHEHFKKKDLLQRQDLYRRICEEIWNPAWFEAQVTI
jgi:Protein of unknown function DUF262/Protein of unknown function (DUF1524)